MAAVVAPLVCAAQETTGELKGVVTFNTSRGGHRADAGAEVIIYLIDSVKTPENKAKQRSEDSIANNSFLSTIYYDEWYHTPSGRAQKQMVRKLRALGAWPENKLRELDNVVATMIRGREIKQCARVTADNNGNYSVRLRPGYYGIIFRSKHLRSRSNAEMNGNIILDDAEVKAGGTTIKNEELL